MYRGETSQAGMKWKENTVNTGNRGRLESGSTKDNQKPEGGGHCQAADLKSQKNKPEGGEKRGR